MDKNRNKSLSPVRLASYGIVTVHKSNHIKLDGNLLNTLGIRAGDRLKVLLDTEERAIIIRAEKGNNKLHRNLQTDE